MVARIIRSEREMHTYPSLELRQSTKACVKVEHLEGLSQEHAVTDSIEQWTKLQGAVCNR